MKTYARIENGVVMELFETAGNIAEMFSAALVWVDVTAASPQPQQNWSAVETNGVWAFAAPVAPLVTVAETAQQMLASGLTIVSASTPALNGTFACDSLSQADIVAIETSLNAGKGFPGAATTFSYPDVTGAMHAFSEANFTDFAAAIRDYVYALKSVIAGSSSMLPAASTTIA